MPFSRVSEGLRRPRVFSEAIQENSEGSGGVTGVV